MLAQVTISSPGWLWPALLLAGVCLAALASSYRSGPVAGPRLPCAFLKALGVTALAFCLLEPLWSTRHARPGANLFVIAADNSQSLEVKDAGATQSRADALRHTLDPDAAWQTALDDLFDTRRFLFDTRLQAIPNFAALTFDGRVTALGTALRGLADRYAGQPLAGVLLFTDGNATDALDGSLNLDGLPPIYPVVLGRPGAARDLAIAQVHVSQTAFEDAPVSIQVDIAASGSRGETVTAQLLDPDGLEVGAQTVRARKDSDTLSCRFQLRPDNPGLSFYRVRVGFSNELEAARAAPPAAPSTREATLVNNTRTVPVERRSEPHRILYVAGRPNWEYKFLNRALEADDQLQLVALMRVAMREPKFEFRGRAGETSNPLFRGFGDQSREEAARYDEPVLVRLNTRDELELRGGFPRTPEELYGFDALVLDDLEAGFFGPDQALLIAKFVSERGGGLLMLGGAESFHQGGYQRTPIGDMLPVYLDRFEPPQNPPTLRWDLAREGWLEPWARLRDTETAEKERRQTMPAFHVLNSVRSVKPGARIIATATDDHGAQHPALVTQRFGRGRTAALMVGDVWRWGMRDASARNDMDKTWRQLLRWLVADVPRPVELAIETSAHQPAEAVRLGVRARDAQFQPLDDASVTIKIEPVSAPLWGPQHARQSPLTPSLSHPMLSVSHRSFCWTTRGRGPQTRGRGHLRARSERGTAAAAPAAGRRFVAAAVGAVALRYPGLGRPQRSAPGLAGGPDAACPDQAGDSLAGRSSGALLFPVPTASALRAGGTGVGEFRRFVGRVGCGGTGFGAESLERRLPAVAGAAPNPSLSGGGAALRAPTALLDQERSRLRGRGRL